MTGDFFINQQRQYERDGRGKGNRAEDEKGGVSERFQERRIAKEATEIGQADERNFAENAVICKSDVKNLIFTF